MQSDTGKRPIAIAIAAAIGASALTTTTPPVAAKTPGKYYAGDFHNHSTCSDGSISMQKLVERSTAGANSGFGLDWFVQAGHGGRGNRNCTLAEDATLGTPAYPYVPGTGPTTTWANSIGAANIKGDAGGIGGSGQMWRWQSVQEYQYPVLEYLSRLRSLPLFIGLESVVAGHEHTSMGVITGQMPASIFQGPVQASPPYAPVGNATALAFWSYCFDRGDTDTSRGNVTGTNVGNNWNCSVPGSLNAADPSWNATAQKLIPASGVGVGVRGHNKTLEALKWMKAFHAQGSYYVPAHLERAGPFNPDGNNGFNVEHLRNFNNVAPAIAFGMETQPGHGASAERGEYRPRRNTIAGVPTDSVGGTTYGGTGVYGAVIGGVWDALLGEGRNWWFFASSDWHNRGSFGPDDRRSTLDFYPGEYQRNFTLVRNGNEPMLSPQMIVDGLRTGNTWTDSGQLIDRLSFIACASYPGPGARAGAAAEALAVNAAHANTDTNVPGCATMGEKLKVRAGGEVVVAIVVRDPPGSSYSPYSFDNPSLLQVGIRQPLDRPVLDHVDVIRGLVSGYRQPGAADYAGEWPRNTNWLRADGTTADLSVVPAAAKNPSAELFRTFDQSTWKAVRRGDSTYYAMSFRIPAVRQSQYLRLRGTNLPASVPFETDASGNPLADFYTNATTVANLRIPCTVTGTNVPANATPHPAGSAPIDGCPNHLPTVTNQPGVPGYPNGYTGRMVAYDVAAWADLWFYSNPIYVEVSGSTPVAGVL